MIASMIAAAMLLQSPAAETPNHWSLESVRVLGEHTNAVVGGFWEVLPATLTPDARLLIFESQQGPSEQIQGASAVIDRYKSLESTFGDFVGITCRDFADGQRMLFCVAGMQKSGQNIELHRLAFAVRDGKVDEIFFIVPVVGGANG